MQATPDGTVGPETVAAEEADCGDVVAGTVVAAGEPAVADDAAEDAAEGAVEDEGDAPPEPDPEAVRALAFIVESVLFAAAKPLGVRELMGILAAGGSAEPSAKEVRASLACLLEDYAPGRRGIVLHEVGSGFQFRTARENAEWVRQVFKEKPARLGRATLETLAIVAYRQPATKAEIEAVRGVDADAALGTLLARRLIKIAGRKEAIGRPLLYATTPEFLEVFGLKNLRDLPALEELAAVTVEEDEYDQESADEPEADAREDAAEHDDGAQDEEAEFAGDGRGIGADGDGGEEADSAPAETGDHRQGSDNDAAPPVAFAGGETAGADGTAAEPGAGSTASGGEAAEDSQPGRDRLAAGGGGDAARGEGDPEWQGGHRTGDEGEPANRSDQD